MTLALNRTAVSLFWLVLPALLPVDLLAGMLELCPYKTEQEWLNSDWHGTLVSGTSISAIELKGILDKHTSWLESAKKNGTRAELSRASLKRAFLQGANLEQANLVGTNLKGADLRYANLRSAELEGADLSQAKLRLAVLRDAHLESADLSQASLQEAFLWGADLTRTILMFADMTAAELRDAIFDRTLICGAQGVYELRKAFRESTYREEERKLTYAIRYSERVYTSIFGGWMGKVESGFQWMLFEVTCLYGYAPWRPFGILGVLVFILSFYYARVIYRGDTRNCIWQEWGECRLVRGPKKRKSFERREKLQRRGRKAYWWGLYFSLLSAFRIGWRDLSLGNWLVRMQRREYVLKATGWPRVVSGIQSLISVYLLALWVLSYFYRPFE